MLEDTTGAFPQYFNVSEAKKYESRDPHEAI